MILKAVQKLIDKRNVIIACYASATLLGTRVGFQQALNPLP